MTRPPSLAATMPLRALIASALGCVVLASGGCGERDAQPSREANAATAVEGASSVPNAATAASLAAESPGAEGPAAGRSAAEDPGARTPAAQRLTADGTADATPRLPDGTPNLGPLANGKGYWDRGSGPQVGGADYPPPEQIPFKPWARALYDYRQRTLAKDDPHARCAPPGGPRQFAVPFGLQIIQVPSIQRIYILSGGSTRPWREIYMDGRAHPEGDLLNPSYFGHSVGRWDGDTLVIDTVGFNERFWIHREGFPHTEALHLTERLSRPDVDTLRYEITIDDPSAYTAPWSASWSKSWIADEEFIEYFCHDNNRDQFHLVGQ